jgi:hypothetical protein
VFKDYNDAEVNPEAYCGPETSFFVLGVYKGAVFRHSTRSFESEANAKIELQIDALSDIRNYFCGNEGVDE